VAAVRAVHTLDPCTLVREPADTGAAWRFAGEPMVQSFSFPLPDGRTGGAWITTAEALAVPGFGRKWVAARLEGVDADALAAGVRLRAADRELLALAA
jgi:hypothetical protein